MVLICFREYHKKRSSMQSGMPLTYPVRPGPGEGMDRKSRLQLSVVVPFYNEEECAGKVCEEILEVLDPLFDSAWEFIAVDDGSDDDTIRVLQSAAADHRAMRVIRSRERLGQSAALKLGFAAAAGELIGTLDGDGQNDPRDLPILLEHLESVGADMVGGVRVNRHDNWVRRISSRIANRVRSSILRDNTTDVGCSVRVFRRQCLENVYLFRNFHRFFPALFVMNGYRITDLPVNHRPRYSGSSKYGGGIRSRLWVGLADLMGVYWLSRRIINPQAAKSSREGPVDR